MAVVINAPDATAERWFFVGLTLTALAVVILGFGNTYYLQPLTGATHTASGHPLTLRRTTMIHAHAILFTGWLVLLAAQVGLVATGRTAVHRRLGMAAVGLIPVMVITGLVTAVEGARNGWQPGGPFPDSLGFMIAGFRDLTIFLVLTGAGLWWRRRPDVHKRLMLLGTIGGLLWPAIVRTAIQPLGFAPMFAVLATLVLALAARDFIVGARARWLSLGVGVAILLTFPVAMVVGNTTGWRAFAAWAVG